MPRTTLDLDAAVRDELRRRSEREAKSMGRVASELLAAAMAEHAVARNAPRALRWHSADLGLPAVDLEDKDALRRAPGDG